jgi:hypothetical protein
MTRIDLLVGTTPPLFPQMLLNAADLAVNFNGSMTSKESKCRKSAISFPGWPPRSGAERLQIFRLETVGTEPLIERVIR